VLIYAEVERLNDRNDVQDALQGERPAHLVAVFNVEQGGPRFVGIAPFDSTVRAILSSEAKERAVTVVNAPASGRDR
jgi:hypothetical protein